MELLGDEFIEFNATESRVSRFLQINLVAFFT